MLIDANKCIKCKLCVPYCPMQCIHEAEKTMFIEEDECVECGICKRNSKCPKDAFNQPFLVMPRAVRKAFSDPFGKHENTEMKHMGRGTEEVKTNDVTGIIHELDRVAIAVELGRPGVGAWMKDVEKVSQTVAKFDVNFEKNNPLNAYIVDLKTGKLEPTIMNEKILSGIIEFNIHISNVKDVLAALKKVAEEVETVFSVAVICKVDGENRPSVENILVDEGYDIRSSSSKTNMGIGRPLYEDRIRGVKP